jgi:hypothetical protein
MFEATLGANNGGRERAGWSTRDFHRFSRLDLV